MCRRFYLGRWRYAEGVPHACTCTARRTWFSCGWNYVLGQVNEVHPSLARLQHKANGKPQAEFPQVEGEVSNLAVPNSPFPFWHSCHEGWTVYSRKKTQIFVVRGKNGNLQPLVINIINLAVQFHRIMSTQARSWGLFRITWKMSIVRDFKNFTYSCKKSFLNFLTCWNCYRST